MLVGKKEVKVFDTDEYDFMDLESIWKNLEKAKILIEKKMERSLTGIKDLDLRILEDFDDRTLFNFCMSSKYGQQLCSNELFWKKRFEKEFPRLGNVYRGDWKTKYLKIAKLMDDILRRFKRETLDEEYLEKRPNLLKKRAGDMIMMGKLPSLKWEEKTIGIENLLRILCRMRIRVSIDELFNNFKNEFYYVLKHNKWKKY